MALPERINTEKATELAKKVKAYGMDGVLCASRGLSIYHLFRMLDAGETKTGNKRYYLPYGGLTVSRPKAVDAWVNSR